MKRDSDSHTKAAIARKAVKDRDDEKKAEILRKKIRIITNLEEALQLLRIVGVVNVDDFLEWGIGDPLTMTQIEQMEALFIGFEFSLPIDGKIGLSRRYWRAFTTRSWWADSSRAPFRR